MKRILFLIICGLSTASCVSQEELLRKQQENEQFIQSNIDEIDRKLIEETEPYEVMKTIREIIEEDQCRCGKYVGLCTTEIVEFPESIQNNLTNLLPFEPRDGHYNQYRGPRDKEDYDTFMKSLQGGLCSIAKDQILFKVAKKMLRENIANDELFFKCIIEYKYKNTDECIIYGRNHDYKGVPIVDYRKYFPTIRTDDEYYRTYSLFEYLFEEVQPGYCTDGLRWNHFNLYHEFEDITDAEKQDCQKTTINNFNAYVKGKKLPSCTAKHYNKLKQAINKAYDEPYRYLHVSGDAYEKLEKDFILKYFCQPNKNEMLKVVK